MNYRKEKDSLGYRDIDSSALYGIQTLRAVENFQIINQKVDETFILNLAKVKRACALANADVGALDVSIAKAIEDVCLEIESGKHLDAFLTTAIQGGAGTSVNMNMNEVIANRAAQKANKVMGTYEWIHPNDHVNHGQSTNDVIPTAGKLTTSMLLYDLLESLESLSESFHQKAIEGKGVIKVGRTHLQDAVLIGMEQVFDSFSSMIKRNIKRLKSARLELDSINLGATAVGTELNTHPGYRMKAVELLSNITGLKLESCENLVDGTKSVDSFAYIHACLKTLAMDLSKICNDLRLMASGPRAGLAEITLPACQPGSSIMPGKVNPVILEVTNQACFQVVGHDATITFAQEAGQMELNVFEPVIFYNLFSSLRILKNATDSLNEKAIKDLVINNDNCRRSVEQSLAIATLFVKHLGYEKTAEVTKQAQKENRSIREILLEEGLLDAQSIDELLQPHKLIRGL